LLSISVTVINSTVTFESNTLTDYLYLQEDSSGFLE
jgi:hypothetical protein